MQLHIILKFVILFAVLTNTIHSATVRPFFKIPDSMTAIGVAGWGTNCANGQKFNWKLNRCVTVWYNQIFLIKMTL